MFAFIIKLICRGFIVMFVHLQAIEKQLGMDTAPTVLEKEITYFTEMLKADYK